MVRASSESKGDGNRFGDGRAEILDAWFEDESGSPARVLPSGRPCSFAMRVRFLADVDDPIFGVTLLTGADETVLGLSTLKDSTRLGRFAAGEEVTFRAAFDNVLRADRYFATPAVAHAGSGVSWIDRRERFVDLVVSGTTQTGALIDLPYGSASTGTGPAWRRRRPFRERRDRAPVASAGRAPARRRWAATGDGCST